MSLHELDGRAQNSREQMQIMPQEDRSMGSGDPFGLADLAEFWMTLACPEMPGILAAYEYVQREAPGT